MSRLEHAQEIIDQHARMETGRDFSLLNLARELEDDRARLLEGIERAIALASNPAVDEGARTIAMKHELLLLTGVPYPKRRYSGG